MINKKFQKLAVKLLPNAGNYLKKQFSSLKNIDPKDKNQLKTLDKTISKSFKKIDKYVHQDIKQNESKFLEIAKKISPKIRKKLDSENENFDEPTLKKKILISIGYFFLVALVQYYLAQIVIIPVAKKLKPNNPERIVTIILTVIVAPITEEITRLYLERKYNAGIVFSAVISYFETLNAVYTSKMFNYSIKRILIGRLTANSMHFINGFIQRILSKKIEDKKKANVLSLTITMIIHGLYNGLITWNEKSVDKFSKGK